MLVALWKDEDGVILSAELVLIGTILIVGMVVGLVELQSAVVAELSDLGDALGNLDQSYQVPGITSYKFCGHVKASTAGTSFFDQVDYCDCNAVITCDGATSAGEGTFRSGGGVGIGSTPYGNSDGSFSAPQHVHPMAKQSGKFTAEEIKELERIKMERRVFERFKTPEPSPELAAPTPGTE